MDDFENGFGSSNQSRPDYYRPTQNNSTQDSFGRQTYYTPPQSEKPYGNDNPSYSSYGGSQPQNNTYYTPPQSSGDYRQDYYSDNNNNNNDNKPPKKSKAGPVIAIVLAVCLLIAGFGIVAGALSSKSSDGGKNDTVQSGDADAKLNDSVADVPLSDKDNNYTVAGVADVAMDSCVGITVYSEKASSYYYFFGYGQNDTSGEPTLSGEGSGVIMSESNGKTYILTCAHVISDGDSFKVTLNDDTEVDAQVVGIDAQTDIGVLAINKTGLKIADFADSTQLVVGEQVVAIGCPGGLEFMNSVTSGYISALDRPISSSIGYNNECIQTDAAINPGNSGGALFNMKGQVVGINSSKIASTEYEGMGFAVPSRTAVETANSLIRVGYVEGRAKIGITYSPITSFNNASKIIEALAQRGYEDANGAMVISEVDPTSDLSSKGIHQYDMIIAVNGDVLTSTDVMTSVLSESSPGDTVTLTIARIENNDIQIKDIECTLIESKG